MIEIKWKRDETPYLIFRCGKCKRYLYVKTIQKAKKCLSCGRTHQVKNIIKSGEIVKGITEAVNRVKIKQNELAIKELAGEPELRTINDFCVRVNMAYTNNTQVAKLKNKNGEEDYSKNFKKLLINLNIIYKEFPSYMIRIMAEEFEIPMEQVKSLKSKFIREGFLLPLKNNYLKLNIN